jgi:hypothetical protein
MLGGSFSVAPSLRHAVRHKAEPKHFRIEVPRKRKVVHAEKVSFIYWKQPCFIKAELRLVKKLRPNDFRRFNCFLICQLRLLQFKPFLSRRPRLQRGLEREEMVSDRRIIVDLNLAFSEY